MALTTLDRDNLTGKNHEGRYANTPVKYLTTASIIGDKVYNGMDEDMGRIRELMVNIHDGRIEYAVIEFGGFLGIGEKYFAVPFKALKIDTERHAFILNQKREVLENAPGFDKDHWPDTNAHGLDATNNYWGSFMGSNTGYEP